MPKDISNYKKELIKNARDVLRGKWDEGKQLKALIGQLEECDQFAYAADVLLRKMNQDIKEGKQVPLRDRQKFVKFIYKDHSLPSSFKFKRALEELNAHDDLLQSRNCETLGLTGAIFKYKWLYDHQSRNLDLSIAHYQRGFECWKCWLSSDEGERKTLKDLNDDGYTAINYAYMLELKAMDELEMLGARMDVFENVYTDFESAREVRTFILNQFLREDMSNGEVSEEKLMVLKKDAYDSWVYATVAEALFGLRRYKAAGFFIQKFKEKEKMDALEKDSLTMSENRVVAWKLRTAYRQLYSMAFIQQRLLESSDAFLQNHGEDSDMSEKKKARINQYKRLKDGIDNNQIVHALATLSSKAVDGSLTRTLYAIKREGKIGLALSGGGFRAALFHIGVLASLAERNMLKDVEVISCVSGGSIIGAFYYLKLKLLLESKSDEEITREDFIALIKEIEGEFLIGIQNNLRMEVLTNWWCNMKMIFVKNYSRTHRLGELYEKYLFSRVEGFRDRKEIFMEDLLISPKGAEHFSLITDNVERVNKVPQLILNATSVNTGHNWQFSATWMGEPPGSIQPEIDVKPRLRRMYYEDAPQEFQKVRLGYAVGASSCVPVMFTPLPMKGLYPDMDLQLVDGGVHDNQGIAALLEQECNNMIISDASGQMETSQKSEANELQMFYRADTILQERIRELQFRDLREREYTSMLNNLITVHLKSDLKQPPVSWTNCTEPPRSFYDELNSGSPDELTVYGVLRSVQQRLAEIRTDLDSFNDTESFALMYSGYLQMNYELNKRNGKYAGKQHDWGFCIVKDYVTNPAKAEKIDKVLRVANKVPFKVFELNTTLYYARLFLMITAAVLLLAGGWYFRNYNIAFPVSLSVKTLLFTFVTLLIGYFVSQKIANYLKIKSWIRKRIALVISLTFMWLVSLVYVGLLMAATIKLEKYHGVRNSCVNLSGRQCFYCIRSKVHFLSVLKWFEVVKLDLTKLKSYKTALSTADLLKAKTIR